MKKNIIVIFILLFSSLSLAQNDIDDPFNELEKGIDSKNSSKTFQYSKPKVNINNSKLTNNYINKYGRINIKKITPIFSKNLKSLDSLNNDNTKNNMTNSYVKITSVVKGTPLITNGVFKFHNQKGWAVAASKHYSFSFVNSAYPNYTHMHIYRDNADTDAKNDAYTYCNSNEITYKSKSSSIYILPVIENFRQDFILKETTCCDTKKYYNIIYQSGDIVCYFYQYPE